MLISGKKVKQEYVLFDGCHKFYLIDSKKITKDMKDRGYCQSDIFPIDDLPYEFYNSCSLRFIQIWNGLRTIVPQGRKSVTFKGHGKYGFTTTINFEKDIIYTDEAAASVRGSARIVFKRMN